MSATQTEAIRELEAPAGGRSRSRAAGGRIRIGIVGSGFISDFHVKALRSIPDVRVTAVCDRDVRKADEAASRWGASASYGEVSAMLRENCVDVVHVLAPPPAHADVAGACLAAGCDLFLEKPAAPEPAECLALHDLAERQGRFAGVNHNFLYHPAFRSLLSTVRRERIGRLERVACALAVPLRQLDAGQHGHWMFSRPENILLEQAVHPLSQLVHLLGPVKKVAALAGPPMRLNTGALFYREWQVSGRFERGCGQLSMVFGAGHYDHWIYAGGEDGSVAADLRRNLVASTEKTRFCEPLDQFLSGAGWARRIAAGSVRNLWGQLSGFLGWRPATGAFEASMTSSVRGYYDARRRGASPPVSLRDAADVIEACLKIAEAALPRRPEAM